jgi:hypothetical protein
MKNNQEDYKCLQYITVQGLSLRGYEKLKHICMRGPRSLCNGDSLTTVYKILQESCTKLFSEQRYSTHLKMLLLGATKPPTKAVCMETLM